MEIWRSLNGIVTNGENYAVSTHGNVKNTVTNKVLKPGLKRTGYYQAALQKNHKAKHYPVHRLVAFAFIDNPENKPFVNHKDGVKSNNHVSNLEWVTPSENNLHALKMGLSSTEKQTEILVRFNSQAVIQYDLKGRAVNQFSSCAEAARHTGVLADTIQKQCRTDAKPRFRNFYFRFANEKQKERKAN